MKQLCQIVLTDTFTSFENLIKKQIPDFVLSDTDTYYLHQNYGNDIVCVLETTETSDLSGGKKYSPLPDSEYLKDLTNNTTLYLKGQNVLINVEVQ